MMVLRYAALAAIITLWTAPANAYAEDIHYDALHQEGFGDEAELVKSMTPQQREAVLKQAAAKQQELKKTFT